MAVLVGREAPDFTAQAVLPDGTFKQVKLSDFRGKYVVLYFYPLDFTFVCPSEIIAFDNHLAEFKERNCEVLGVSVDSHFSHHAWRNTPVDKGGIGAIQYPLIAVPVTFAAFILLRMWRENRLAHGRLKELPNIFIYTLMALGVYFIGYFWIHGRL